MHCYHFDLVTYAYLGMISRVNYYFILAESACNVAGFGFNGYNEFHWPKWDLVMTVDVKGSEFPRNFKELSTSWNASTGKWLRR